MLYAHGFVSAAREDLVVQNPSLRALFIASGFAWGASSCSRNGYVIDDPVEETHALLERFDELPAATEDVLRTLGAPVTVIGGTGVVSTEIAVRIALGVEIDRGQRAEPLRHQRRPGRPLRGGRHVAEPCVRGHRGRRHLRRLGAGAGGAHGDPHRRRLTPHRS